MLSQSQAYVGDRISSTLMTRTRLQGANTSQVRATLKLFSSSQKLGALHSRPAVALGSPQTAAGYPFPIQYLQVEICQFLPLQNPTSQPSYDLDLVCNEATTVRQLSR